MGANPHALHKVQLEKGDGAPKMEKTSLEQVRDSLTPQQIQEAQEKFAKYDKDKSGTIEKDELRELLMESMGNKKMGEGMIKRFVDAQFQLYDKDGSGNISMDEFLVLFAKMFTEQATQSPRGPPIGMGPPPQQSPRGPNTGPPQPHPPPGKSRGVPMPGM